MQASERMQVNSGAEKRQQNQSMNGTSANPYSVNMWVRNRIIAVLCGRFWTITFVASLMVFSATQALSQASTNENLSEELRKLHERVNDIGNVLGGLEKDKDKGEKRFDVISTAVANLDAQLKVAEKRIGDAIASTDKNEKIIKHLNEEIDASRSVLTDTRAKWDSISNAYAERLNLLTKRTQDSEQMIRMYELKAKELLMLLESLSQESNEAKQKYEEYIMKITQHEQNSTTASNAPLENEYTRIEIVYERHRLQQMERVRSILIGMRFQVSTKSVDDWDQGARSRRRNLNLQVPPVVPAQAIIAGELSEDKVVLLAQTLSNELGADSLTPIKLNDGNRGFFDVRSDQVLIMLR